MDKMGKTVLAIAIALTVALAAIGFFRGEFRETWYNGSTL
jgi:hypothetical protein